MLFKVAIICCNYIFGEGIKTFLEEHESGTDTIINSSDPNEVISANPDLLITDFFTLCTSFHDVSFKHRVQILLLGTVCLPNIENERLKDFISKGLVGILSPTAKLSELKKAINSVVKGELWLDRCKLKSIIPETNHVLREKRPCMTEKEIEIVKMICNGHSNKEIQKTLTISEQSVKSHLSRIYKKTGVSDRLQLALFALNSSKSTLNQMCQVPRYRNIVKTLIQR